MAARERSLSKHREQVWLQRTSFANAKHCYRTRLVNPGQRLDGRRSTVLLYYNNYNSWCMMSGFHLTVATGTGIPIYRQIADHVRMAVATGALAPGETMPSVRA